MLQWLKSALRRMADSMDVTEAGDVVRAMRRAESEGRPAPAQTEAGWENCVVARAYPEMLTVPCEWPYCDCTKGKPLARPAPPTTGSAVKPVPHEAHVSLHVAEHLRTDPISPEFKDSYQIAMTKEGYALVCYGCAHSSGHAPYPGCPSGERPCMFCIRNTDPRRDESVARIKATLKHGGSFTARYDNGPTRKEIGDQYIATDRLTRDIPDGTHVIT